VSNSSEVSLSYAICVCDEARELKNLLTFLEEARDKSKTEIVILVDSSKTTKDVAKCLKEFKDSVNVHYRDFDGDFSDHKNFLNSKCVGKNIFNIDADEIPQEALLKAAEMISEDIDLIMVPRINICPGYTLEFLKRWKFAVNNAGWINWPDFQGRIYRNSPDIKWVGKVHEKINSKRAGIFTPEPDAQLALWHIKDVARQNKQNEEYEQLSPPIVNETSKDGSGN
jgi:hypothetical protein